MRAIRFKPSLCRSSRLSFLISALAGAIGTMRPPSVLKATATLAHPVVGDNHLVIHVVNNGASVTNATSVAMGAAYYGKNPVTLGVFFRIRPQRMAHDMTEMRSHH